MKRGYVDAPCFCLILTLLPDLAIVGRKEAKRRRPGKERGEGGIKKKRKEIGRA